MKMTLSIRVGKQVTCAAHCKRQKGRRRAAMSCCAFQSVVPAKGRHPQPLSRTQLSNTIPYSFKYCSARHPAQTSLVYATGSCQQRRTSSGVSHSRGPSQADRATAPQPDNSSGSGGGGNRTPRLGGGSNGPEGDDASSPESGCALLQLLQQLLVMLAAVGYPAVLPAPSAAAAAVSKRSSLVSHQDEMQLSSWQIDAFVDRMWNLSGPIMTNMGTSGLFGACAAAALKWVGRTLAASLGMGLVLIQVLSYYNVITVNWSVVHKQARQVLDTTGDGRLDQDDFKRVVKQGLVVLSEGVPSVSGFLVGFIVGLKVF